MASCDSCGTTILFGGVRQGDLRFCNERCRQKGFLLAVAQQVPEDVLSQYVQDAHQGQCPACNGPGPIDVHTSYTIWSLLVLTSWRSRPQICCQSCGTKSKIGGAVSSALFGWWGFPWGIIITPIQILRNVWGLFVVPDPAQPSLQLEKLLSINLAAQLAEQHRQKNEPD
jgi:hypothetical protein